MTTNEDNTVKTLLIISLTLGIIRAGISLYETFLERKKTEQSCSCQKKKTEV